LGAIVLQDFRRNRRSKLAGRGLPHLVCLLLLLPLMFASPDAETPLHVGLPRVFSGDEPHYLVLINSLLLDGDLELSDNYAAVHQGATQAGLGHAGEPLDDHTVWFENGVRRRWAVVFETDPDEWDEDDKGNPVPRLRPGQAPPAPGHPEYSQHPPGLAFLLAPVLFPLRHTELVEPVAICCSAIAVIAGMFAFRALLRKYNPDGRWVDLVAAVTFLGTPAWHYGRTLFTEPYLLMLATGAYAAALRANRPLLAGTLIGLGMLMKPPLALLIVPLILMHVLERRWGSAAMLGLPTVASVAVLLWLNDMMFGSPWRPSQVWEPVAMWPGLIGPLFSPTYGYLITAPAIVIAFAAWPRFLRTCPRDGAVLAAGILLYFAFFASYNGGWSGADCYSTRYMVPVLPLVFVPLAMLPKMKLWQAPSARYAVAVLCALSIVVNGLAAMPYWTYWDTNPIEEAVNWALHGVHPADQPDHEG
jgi:hypothetical protein